MNTIGKKDTNAQKKEAQHRFLKLYMLTLPTLAALCSIALGKPVQSSMAIIGDFSSGKTIIKVDNLASTLQVYFDNEIKKKLSLLTLAFDFGTVPSELMNSFSFGFYKSAEDAVLNALEVG